MGNIAPAHIPTTLGKMHVTVHKGKRLVKLNAMHKSLFSVRITCNGQIMRTAAAPKKSPVWQSTSSFLIFDTETSLTCTVFNHPSEVVSHSIDAVLEDQIIDNVVGK